MPSAPWLVFVLVFVVAPVGGQVPGTRPSSAAQGPAPCTSSGDRKVNVRLLVTPKGLPDQVRLMASNGDACADRLALQAVREYRFPPQGVPVHLTIAVDVANRSTTSPASR